MLLFMTPEKLIFKISILILLIFELSRKELQCNPYETSSAAAALQSDFKKHYKRAVKALAATVANFGFSGKPFDSDKQRCLKIPESRSVLQGGCKVASKRQRMLLPVMAYHSLVQKKGNTGSNKYTIIMIHGRRVDKALVEE